MTRARAIKLEKRDRVSEARGVSKHLDYSVCAVPGKAGYRPDPSPAAP